jgi:transposase-like protein
MPKIADSRFEICSTLHILMKKESTYKWLEAIGFVKKRKFCNPCRTFMKTVKPKHGTDYFKCPKCRKTVSRLANTPYWNVRKSICSLL